MPKSTPPLVSIVILSWNTLDETKSCIESVQRLVYPNTEIVVVDNGSRDGSKKYLESLNDIVYVDLAKNTGFTGGQIAGYKVAKGKYLALVNSDAVVATDWLDVLVPIMESDSSVGAVGGRAYTWRDDEKPYDINNDFYTFQVVDEKRGYAATSTVGTKQVEVDSISGAGVLISREAIEMVGYFDNRFFAYYEETDLFARMIRAGYRILYEPNAHVWHQIAKSTKDKPYFYLYQMHRNRFLFAFKNFDKYQAGRFFTFYVLDGLRSHIKFLRTKDIDQKARVKSLWWNLANLIPTYLARRSSQKLGKTYNKKLLRNGMADDITVIIPCYNYASFVGEAIESALNQTLKPQRIVVIDDGSTDESTKVIERYKKQGIELITKSNEGVVATKNVGIGLSMTTWTVFLDADDVLEPNYLESVYKRALSGRYDIVYTDMRYFGAKDGVHIAGRYNFTRLLKGNYIHNSALIATRYLKEVNGYKDAMRGGYEDWELYITLAEAGAKYAYVPKPLLRYRQHENQGRNINAEGVAKNLHQQVRNLHKATYKKHWSFYTRASRMVNGLIKHPLLPAYLLIKSPRIIASTIKATVKYLIWRFGIDAKNYVQARNSRKTTDFLE